ncbi:MAG: hypothetical protein HZA24_05565 [Nitrospirae bacterium]|nr:hypothetical protein [Nitrospirota bacterium]
MKMPRHGLFHRATGSARRSCGPSAPAGALLILLTLLSAACGAGVEVEYQRALAALSGLEQRVDAGFDRVRARNDAIFAASAWNDPAALAQALTAARDGMAAVAADQRSRIARERAMLDLKAMANAPITRELYHLDLDAQHAKLAVFDLSHEMYGALLDAARAGGRARFDELAGLYRGGVDAANRRYAELDLARQQRQRALTGGDAPI